MGLLHITNAVSFLNNDCKLVRPAWRVALGGGMQGPGCMLPATNTHAASFWLHVRPLFF